MTATTPQAAAGAGAARPRQRVVAQAVFEGTTLLRNGEQLLVSLMLPCLALVALAVSSSPSLGPGRRVDLAVPGVLALGVLSTAFTGQAIQTGFDRRYGVLRLLGVTPLGRRGLLLAKAAAVLTVELLQVIVIGGLGLAFGWHPHWSGIPIAVLVGLLGTWAWVALALLLAGTLRAEGVLAVANLLWILLLGLGGVIFPRDQLSGAASTALAFLPSSALGDGLRAALIDGRFDLTAAAVLLVWGLVATTLASRLFRWSD